MTDNELISIKTDIALIQRDIKQIDNVSKKIDLAVVQMTEVLKTIAVQENILENKEKRIAAIEESIKQRNEDEEEFRKEFSKKLEDMKDSSHTERERRHKELMDSIEALNKTVTEKIEKQNKRIQDLESWRWYLLGIGVVILFILNKIPWAVFFG